jgi:hypothetical protein
MVLCDSGSTLCEGMVKCDILVALSFELLLVATQVRKIQIILISMEGSFLYMLVCAKEVYYTVYYLIFS